MLKRVKWVAIFLAVGLIVVYVAMIMSVRSIIHEAEAVFLDNSTDDTSIFRRYSTSRYGQSVHRKAKVIPLFAFHNNRDGYVYVAYSYEVRDEAGDLLSGAKNVISRWNIAKEAGRWKAVSIIEEP